MRAPATHDVVVIGAGIIGCAAALELVRAGLRVAVVERGPVAGATTSAGMGHIVVLDDSPAQLALTMYSRALWREMEGALPLAAEYRSPGTLWVAADEGEMTEVVRKQASYARGGVIAEVLDSDEVAQVEPALRGGLAGGLLVPEDGVLFPPAAAWHFLEEARRLGAQLLLGREVVSCEDGRVEFARGEDLTCGQILLASGADIGLLPWLPIRKRKGHLLMTDAFPALVRHQVVELGYLKSAHNLTADSVALNVQPRANGALLIGASRQFADESLEPRAEIVERLKERAGAYLPALRGLSDFRVRTGFRAATEDHLPLIGPTEDASLFLAMGFEGLGITCSPGAARLVVDAMLGRASAIDAGPYLPRRVLRE